MPALPLPCSLFSDKLNYGTSIDFYNRIKQSVSDTKTVKYRGHTKVLLNLLNYLLKLSKILLWALLKIQNSFANMWVNQIH